MINTQDGFEDFTQWSDEALMDGIKDRAELEQGELFAILYERYHNRMLHYLYGFVFDQQLAEDLYQEAMIKLYHNLSKYRSGEKFSSWFYRIVSNTAISHLRKNKIRNRVASEVDLGDWEVEIEDEQQTTPEKDTLQRDMMDLLYRSLDQIPEKFRMVVLLRMQGEQTFREIGQVLKISERTAKWRMKRGVELLKELMQDAQ